MVKAKLSVDEKFEKQDFDLFEALSALDKKDYDYYDRLSEEQQKKFVPYMMLLWTSCIKGNKELSSYYVMNTEFSANKYFFNENIQKHPKLQWLMLCTVSPGIGKQFHQWIPHVKEKVSRYKESAKEKEIKEYFNKIYKTDTDTINELTEAYVSSQKRKVHLSSLFPNLKLSDIETLNEIVTDQDIKQYDKDSGN